ncbi:serine hydrolase [Lentisphaera marina]|uniref:D-alanyl-D-alanine carboxypeptidase family protein n=1 Tax=Lentisphaera marina TaxID=1111041 RepID=UPI0023663D90|nr:serine hydrolase [Lentisphaera marina]MDD7983833.1 serine hydrolase [Lentisphaera marina]
MSKIPKPILITLPILILAIAIYFSGQYLQKKANTQFSKTEVKKIAPLKKPAPFKKVEVEKFKRFNIADKHKNEKSAYRFPSTRNVRAGLVFEMNAGKTLWSTNANKSVPIASLTKCLTVLTVLDHIKENPQYSLLDQVLISKSSMKTSSSSFLRKYPKDTISVEELLVSAMVKSANDSCQLIAEHFGKGDPKVFIAMMNKKAQQLGMTQTKMSNAHGLPFDRSRPDLDNHSSMSDLLHLIRKSINDYPIILKWTSKREVLLPSSSHKAVKLGNTNPLLAVKGVNGYKTGFTLNAGWCQILTTRANGKFYFLVITGCPNKNTRDVTMRALMNWAVRVP